MLEFAASEILGVEIGICVHSYLGMADNGDVVYPQEFLILNGEYPIPVSLAVPVVGGMSSPACQIRRQCG